MEEMSKRHQFIVKNVEYMTCKHLFRERDMLKYKEEKIKHVHYVCVIRKEEEKENNKKLNSAKHVM